MSQETKKQIEDLISEYDILMESLRKFFYLVSYEGEPVPLHYRWFKLTNDQFLEQDELFRRYITWAASARNLIEKFLPEKLAFFDEKSEIVRKWIEMSELLPSDDSAEMFLRFRKHFVSQQNIVSALLEQIK